VTVDSEAENAWVCSAFNDGFTEPFFAWIGLYEDPPSSGNWAWISGAPVDYLNWHPDEPNNSFDVEDWACLRTEDCMWNDYRSFPGPDTTYPLQGIVEREGCPENTWCQWTIAEGGNGHWYRFTQQHDTWQDAEEEAVGLGAHLVTVDSEAENAWLCSAFNHGFAEPFFAWIGLYEDPPSSGNWAWISGAPVDYLNWHPDEPNNSFDVEDWACLRSEDCMWNDYRSFPGGGTTYRLRGIAERPFAPGIPAVGEWGMVVMVLLVLTAGTLACARARPVLT
jgi:hypothetical protein